MTVRDKIHIFFCIRARGSFVGDFCLVSIRDLILLDSYATLTVGSMATRYDQTIFFLQLPAKGAIQFLLQVCYGIERRETKQLCADALHILITPETATGLICYKLVEHLYKRLPLIRYALFFALLDAGQIFNGHRAKNPFQ